MSTPSARVLSLVVYLSKLRTRKLFSSKANSRTEETVALLHRNALFKLVIWYNLFTVRRSFVRACVHASVCACARSVVHLTYQVVSTLINSGLLCQEESTLSYK